VDRKERTRFERSNHRGEQGQDTKSQVAMENAMENKVEYTKSQWRTRSNLLSRNGERGQRSNILRLTSHKMKGN
jgi:hypothetical protein